MGSYRCVLVSLTLLGLFVQVCSALLTSCPTPPQCGEGFGLKNCACVRCSQDQYRVVRNRLPSCQSCTEKCSGERNLTEASPCSPNKNRLCHCDRGFFCESAAQFSCRRCLPCPVGTFSNNISMNDFCQAYTDCAGRGLAVISSGSSTRDRLCDYLISPPQPNDFHVSNAETTQFSTPLQTIPLPVTTHKPQTTNQLPTVDRTARASSSINELVFEESSSSLVTSLVLMVVLVAAAILVVCCMWHKHHLLKKKGWPFLKHLQVQGRKEDTMDGDLCFVSQRLLGNNTGNAQQVGPPKQQVAIYRSGGGDSVSNNVGSIYIYSPKMVVLGTNTAEQREEAKPPGEVGAPLGTPHQEQGPMDRSPWPVTECVQQEEGKELSYPVPATSK
ncbi:hypothetical protein COCON_G00181140 [Conger conger]|uniref:TNFR-Cys domain-containing protein n=1 Tax=Conger conger TaxID=82655 RepID=A0A9Q1D6F2_CONCO|nr:hypothetical protein COCON_G00181140 [Conger conger]